MRAATVAARKGGRLTRAILEAQALSIAQCEQMHAETADGELKLQSNRPTSVHHVAASLGYSNDGYVHQNYPELCRAIGEKIALAKPDEPDKMRRALEDALHEHPAQRFRN